MKDKRILILGGTGSLGQTLTTRYISKNKVFIFSRGENNQWLMKQQFNDPNLHFFVGDIRDKERLENCLFKSMPNIIIIASALKHIDVCESNVNECINTNINGIRNIVDLIVFHAMCKNIPFLETVVFVSTDKACAPVNVYGMCKAISERIMVEKNLQIPKFVNVRYGNVLSSRGSIIPLYENIAKDEKQLFFPVTDEKMTRYFMTLEQSVDLIDYAIKYGESGDTIIPKEIPSYKIVDIANYFSEKYNKPIKITGIRQGEKIHETLISFTESLRTVETPSKNYYIIKPTYAKVEKGITFPYGEFNSQCTLRSINGLFNSSFGIKKTVLVFGSAGMLGRYITSYLRKKNFTVIEKNRSEFDVYISLRDGSIYNILDKFMTTHNPDIIVNCAGITNKRAVSLSEMYAVNSIFPIILDSYATNNRRVILPATDCIFSGEKGMYSKDDKAEADYKDDYGVSKQLGENTKNTCVIRVSIIGEEVGRCDSLLEWVRGNVGKTIGGYTNHFWNGITCLEYAKLLERFINNDELWIGTKQVSSTFNGRNEISKYELVKLINDVYNFGIIVSPVEAPKRVDRTLKGDILVGDLGEQIKEMQKYFF